MEPGVARHRYETSTGVGALKDGWSVYGSLTAALFADSIQADGWRIRASTGFGRYGYARRYDDPSVSRHLWQSYESQASFADLMIGYQQQLGSWTIKAYAGVTGEGLDESPNDQGLPGTARADINFGWRIGFKGALETWWRLGNWGFVQTDVSWGQPARLYNGRMRLGYRVTPKWSTGGELGAFGAGADGRGRLGAFLRYEWDAGEASVSAGGEGTEDELASAYGTFNVLFRF